MMSFPPDPEPRVGCWLCLICAAGVLAVLVLVVYMGGIH